MTEVEMQNGLQSELAKRGERLFDSFEPSLSGQWQCIIFSYSCKRNHKRENKINAE
jgi:hypothetical protein